MIILKFKNKDSDDKFNTLEDRAPNIDANYAGIRIYNYNPDDEINEIK